MAWTKRTARQAAFLYLLMGLPAPINLMYMPGKFIVAGDAAATVSNISANEMTYRLCIFAGMVSSVAFIFLVVTLYELFQEVDRRQARLMVALVTVSSALGLVTLLNEIAPLILLHGADSFAAFSKPQLDALSLGFLNLRSTTVSVNSVLWGLWLFPFGILAIKSGFIPKLIGAALIVSGVAYVVSSVTFVLFPQYHHAVTQVTLPLGVGELFMMLWLFIKGIRLDGPSARPSYAT